MKRPTFWRHPAQRLAWLYGILIGCTVLAASLGRLPVRRIINRFPWSDKAGHFLLMGLLAYLISLSLGATASDASARGVASSGARRRLGVRLWKGNLLLLALLVGEEISQLWMTYRAFEVADLMADTAGVFTFGLLAHWRLHRRVGLDAEATAVDIDDVDDVLESPLDEVTSPITSPVETSVEISLEIGTSE